jgi:hypothetical protein
VKTIYESVINNNNVRIRYHYTGACELQAISEDGYPFHIYTFDNMVEALVYVKSLERAA